MASRTDTPKCNRINSICLTNKTHATKKWDAAPLSIQAASAQDTDFNFEQDQEIDVVVVLLDFGSSPYYYYLAVVVLSILLPCSLQLPYSK
jgi:hypothetical protein